MSKIPKRTYEEAQERLKSDRAVAGLRFGGLLTFLGIPGLFFPARLWSLLSGCCPDSPDLTVYIALTVVWAVGVVIGGLLIAKNEWVENERKTH